MVIITISAFFIIALACAVVGLLWLTPILFFCAGVLYLGYLTWHVALPLAAAALLYWILTPPRGWYDRKRKDIV